ncbi:MAG TPA: hypothetical protein DD379_20460 [Cyanobacteria bacterium UBA11162]|nr:hypothetical protein [Cyanobacteria bacterium UBA11162]
MGQGAKAKPKIKQKVALPKARTRGTSWEVRRDNQMLPMALTRRMRKVGSITITSLNVLRGLSQFR